MSGGAKFIRGVLGNKDIDNVVLCAIKMASEQ